MTSEEEWIEKFREEVRRVLEGMVMFDQTLANSVEHWLEDDPIKHEKKIRDFLHAFGGGLRVGNRRGTNRGDDVVGVGRQVAWSCENDKCMNDHCTLCGQCKANRGDGHSPWHTVGQPPCPKRPSRKDVLEGM